MIGPKVPTRARAEFLIKNILGPHGRLWKRNKNTAEEFWEIGLERRWEQQPGGERLNVDRKVIAKGPTLLAALARFHLALEKEKAQ